MPDETSLKQEGKLIGSISHYFGKIGVAIIDLTDNLSAGDKLRIVGGDTEVEQEVQSMEIDHQKVEAAKVGDSVGIKVEQKVREGYKVYKI